MHTKLHLSVYYSSGYNVKLIILYMKTLPYSYSKLIIGSWGCVVQQWHHTTQVIVHLYIHKICNYGFECYTYNNSGILYQSYKKICQSFPCQIVFYINLQSFSHQIFELYGMYVLLQLLNYGILSILNHFSL